MGRRGAGHVCRARLKTPCTRQKAQPGPAVSKPLGMTGPLRNSLGGSTELHGGAAFAGTAQSPCPIEVPRSSPVPGHLRAWGIFGDQHNQLEKKQVLVWSWRASPRCARVEERSRQSQPAGESVNLQPTTRPATSLQPRDGRRGCLQAPRAAPRAPEAALARAVDAPGT